MTEHRELTTYSRLRPQLRHLFPPTKTIRRSKLYHRQVYSFAYHRPKLALLRESRQHKRFAPLADFLERVPNDCPHELFRESSRASQIPNFVNRNHLIVVEKENFATRTAALIVPTVGDNRLRHEALQRFMLANDSVTVAVEIPIWLTAADIDALEVEHGLQLFPEGGSPRVLTGHIDFLQVRNGAVHILDYKPDARTNKPIAQLTLYALALTRLGGIAPLRYQVRLVQRGAILRVLSPLASRTGPAERWRRGRPLGFVPPINPSTSPSPPCPSSTRHPAD